MQCNRHQEGSPAGTMIRLVNAVAENFPDKTISPWRINTHENHPNTATQKCTYYALFHRV